MRKRQEINEDYSKHACLLGDKIYRQAVFSAEIQAIQKKMNELCNEKAEDELQKENEQELM
jgi:hypothetical protein